jgi:LuxR family maltose regulon positive regulatory protein
LTLADSLFALGRFDEARRWLAQAIRLAAQQGADDVSRATAMESLIDLTQGSLATARVRLECFAAQGKSVQGDVPDVVHALVLYESGSLDQAQQLLSQTPSSIPSDSPAETLIVTRLLLARIAWSQDDVSTCFLHLALLEQSARDRVCSRIHCAVWIERASIATLQGRIDVAVHAIAQMDRHRDRAREDVLGPSNDVETPTVARVRLHIAQGRFSEAAGVLRPAIEQACQRGRLRLKLKLRLLLAVSLDGMGQHTAAITELGALLPFASEEGWRSTFVEEGACVAKLLQRWTQRSHSRGGESGIVLDFVGDLLKRLGVREGASSADGVTQSAHSRLTEREHQVLNLIAQGLQTGAIAASLRLSGHTVKAHLRNIYRKLGAHGQVEAAAIARARGLLDDTGEPTADRSRQRACRPGSHHRLGPPGHPQFAVDVLDVRLDRIGRDVQPFADLTV